MINGWQLGEEVKAPGVGFGIVEGMVRMHGRLMLILAPMPEEILYAVSAMDKLVALVMIDESLVVKNEVGQ